MPEDQVMQSYVPTNRILVQNNTYEKIVNKSYAGCYCICRGVSLKNVSYNAFIFSVFSIT